MASLPRSHSIDWPRLVQQLRLVGLSLNEIARRIDVPRTRLQAWVYHSCEPRHADGERLVALWLRLVIDERTELPTVRRYARRTA